MVLGLGEPPRRFLLLLFFISFCHFIFDLHFVVVLNSLLFDVILHPSVDYRRVFTPILYFWPSPLQSDSRHFHFEPFRYLLTASATVLRGCFLPTVVFYLTLLHQHFWLNLHLSRHPWEPAVLPWSLQGFILILETQTRPICLFESQ